MMLFFRTCTCIFITLNSFLWQWCLYSLQWPYSVTGVSKTQLPCINLLPWQGCLNSTYTVHTLHLTHSHNLTLLSNCTSLTLVPLLVQLHRVLFCSCPGCCSLSTMLSNSILGEIYTPVKNNCPNTSYFRKCFINLQFFTFTLSHYHTCKLSHYQNFTLSHWWTNLGYNAHLVQYT